MADTIDLANDLSELGAVDANDLLLGYSKSGKKFGYIPVSVVVRGGYACRRWNMNNSSPTGEAYGDVQYLADLPDLLGLGCYLVDANHGRRKLDPTNHYKFATGETAALDGSMGDYMWGWNTKWYYAWWVEGNYYYEAASLKPIPGRYNYIIPVASMSAVGGIVMDRTNNKAMSIINKSTQYRGGGNDSAKDDAYNTMLGTIATNMTAAQFSAAAHNKGDGWEAGYYAHYAAVGILFRIIFGTRNVQATYNGTLDANGCMQGGLGEGLTSFSQWSSGFSYYPFMQTDYTSQIKSGAAITTLGDWAASIPVSVKYNADGNYSNMNMAVFFGLQHPFGYMGRIETGRLINMVSDNNGGYYGEVYVAKSFYNFIKQSGNTMSLTGKVKVATLPTITAAGWTYPTRMSNEALCHAATVLGGSSSTYFCDGTYFSASAGLRVPLVGGYAVNGDTAGLEYLGANSGVTFADVSCGSPLCEAAEDWSTEPVLVSADA
jgi:hypothetical protein